MRDAMPLLLLLAGGGLFYYLWSTNQIGPIVVKDPSTGLPVPPVPVDLTSGSNLVWNCPGGPNCP
jgi:hypothetical protein